MHRIMKTLLHGLLCLALVLSCGCSGTSRTIAYTVYPIGYLLNRIAGSTIHAVSVQSDTMVQNAQAVDDFKTVLSGSAVFIHMGDLEPFLSVHEEDVQKYAKEELDLSGETAIYDFARYYADGSERPYYEDECFENVDVCEKEQSVWLDPISMLSMGRSICAWLKEKYPEDADYYQSNMDTLANELIELDGQYQTMASDLKKEGKTLKFAMMSSGFGIWQNAYGFEVYPVVLSRYGVLPDAAQLAAVKEHLAEDGVKYIVYEPNMSDAMKAVFSTLEEQMGLTRIELSNLSSLSTTQMQDGKDYLSVMKENLLVLETVEPDDIEE